MLSNTNSGDLSLRRFLVLEDSDEDFRTECQFLLDLCDRCALHSHREELQIESVEIIRLCDLAPISYRTGMEGGVGVLRPSPSLLTAPFAIGRSEGRLIRFQKTGGQWEALDPSELPQDPTLVVPWRTTDLSAANYFMPHGVLLDMFTSGSRNAFETTRNLLRGAWYPSDLLWVLSGEGGENDPYGIFFPKFETLAQEEKSGARDYVLRKISGLFFAHAERLRIAKKEPASVSTYLDGRANNFYEDFVMPESWRRRVHFVGDSPDAEIAAALDRVWSVSSETRNGRGGAFRWSVGKVPTSESGVFTFFTNELRGSDQWRYASGHTFGLPSRYLWANEPIAPEDVIAQAARIYTNRQTSYVLRRNLAIFLHMVLGHAKNFNGLSAAIPDLKLSYGTFLGIAYAVLGGEIDRARDEVMAKRRSAGRGQPFVDWVKRRFYGSL